MNNSKLVVWGGLLIAVTAVVVFTLQAKTKQSTRSSASEGIKTMVSKRKGGVKPLSTNRFAKLAAVSPVHPCTFASVGKVVELIEENDGSATNRPLRGLPDMAFRSTIVTADNTPVYPEPFVFPVDRKTAEIASVNVDLPDIQQNAGYANVELIMPESYKKRFEVVGQFCEPKDPFDRMSAIGCPMSLNSKSMMSGFRLQCGADIEYGWYVRRKPYVLAGNWSLARAVNEFPGFRDYFKAEICDIDAKNGGNCSTFKGTTGSIYGAINSQVRIPSPVTYSMQVKFNIEKFITNFDNDTTSTGIRQQTVSLNTFAHNQDTGLPLHFSTTYNGCVPLPRDETKPGTTKEEPYRCELQVDEINGFEPVDIFTNYAGL